MTILSATHRRLNTLSLSAIAVALGVFAVPAANAADVNKSVAAVYYGEVGVGNFDPTGYHAYQEMLKNNGFDKSEFAESVPFEKAVEVLTDFGRRDFGLVIVHSEGYQAAVHRVAADFPNTHFVISPAGEAGDLPNVSVYRENPFHVLLLPGLIASLSAKSGQVGYIGAIPLPGILKEGGGFLAGAKLGNPDVKFQTVWINSFSDAGKAKEAASAMFSSGADVVGHTVDTASQGIFQAAREAGKKAIGGFADEGQANSDVVLTSGIYGDLHVWDRIAKDYLSGSIKPGVHEFGLCDGGVTLGVFNGVSDEIKAKVETVRDDICSGKLKLEEQALPTP